MDDEDEDVEDSFSSSSSSLSSCVWGLRMFPAAGGALGLVSILMGVMHLLAGGFNRGSSYWLPSFC